METSDPYIGELKGLKPKLLHFTGVTKGQIYFRLVAVYCVFVLACVSVRATLWNTVQWQVGSIIRLIALAGSLLSLYIFFLMRMLKTYNENPYLRSYLPEARCVEKYKSYNDKEILIILRGLLDKSLASVLSVYRLKIGGIILSLSVATAVILWLLKPLE